MDKKRKEEIALALIEALIRERPIRLSRNEFHREVERLAKATGISSDELTTFFKILIQEAVDEMFAS